ncbi:MAG: hypothetical protein WBE65_01750 [Steroidobacteraceae bacterium]
MADPGAISVLEAVEWREPAPSGGSKSQVFRLADGRFAVVKFPENAQGERVLANEFLCCQLAEDLGLPINLARLVSIDERTLRAPRKANQIPADYSAGIRCGMIRFEQNQVCQAPEVLAQCGNAADLHAVALFEQFVCRGDGRQLLMYPPAAPTGGKPKFFAAYDYGFAFGGQPNWSAASLAGLPAVVLPMNPFDNNKEYADGTPLSPGIELLRKLTGAEMGEVLMRMCPPRWGVPPEDVAALVPALLDRAARLVAKFDGKFKPQMEIA